MHEPQPPEAALASLIGHVAGVLAGPRFPTGDRAALRRMTPGKPLPLVFTRFALQHLPDGWEPRRDAWATLLAGIAIMSPAAHRPGRGLGRALAEANYSEARLERLLATEGDTLRTLLLRAARFLAAKGAAFDWTDAAGLLLTTDAQKRDRLHQRIARDFFSHQRTEQTSATA